MEGRGRRSRSRRVRCLGRVERLYGGGTTLGHMSPTPMVNDIRNLRHADAVLHGQVFDRLAISTSRPNGAHLRRVELGLLLSSKHRDGCPAARVAARPVPVTNLRVSAL